ncbi:N-acetylmannosamine-6-phosphate 2-epimerase [Clostridium tarantellae]|uniref:Putative N-acetylmannosamine-6-phosphate 2-epimerase n=1 Tax=Clostridium tarantellae TaxID=39493 RepID=A0A6I1MLH0_9CLOT|nr:N-acetylmannosamine-6-phosphate 2-epimerase [Clostridium tarantellae]MPQ43268.1 putative N-acetylmannosamine-6-phosphate 2-epimerase [Clostridium tarantellae]
MKRGLIVSCQALENEPLHSSFIMSKMALAAKQGGAVGIRANSAEDIKAIKEEVDLPIIGIVKKDYDNMIPYITPTMKEIKELIEVGVDVIAVDATINQDVNFLKSLKELYPNQKFMADISTVEEGVRAEKFGFDYIGTTLVGYTKQSKGLNNFDVLIELIEKCNKPVIAEGNFDTPEKTRRAIECGSYAVVVGSIITRPQIITQRFTDELNKAL